MAERGSIFGLLTNGVLPDGWMPVEAVAVIKCLDTQGEPRLLVVATATLNQWEAVGMLTGALDNVRDDLAQVFVPPEEADDA